MSESTKEAKAEKSQKAQANEEKDDGPFKALIAHLPHTTNQDDIKRELESLGHKVLEMSNITNDFKTPLPLFLMELERKENNKEIFKIVRLLEKDVIIEPFEKKWILSQILNAEHAFSKLSEGGWTAHHKRRTFFTKLRPGVHVEFTSTGEPLSEDQLSSPESPTCSITSEFPNLNLFVCSDTGAVHRRTTFGREKTVRFHITGKLPLEKRVGCEGPPETHTSGNIPPPGPIGGESRGPTETNNCGQIPTTESTGGKKGKCGVTYSFGQMSCIPGSTQTRQTSFVIRLDHDPSQKPSIPAFMPRPPYDNLTGPNFEFRGNISRLTMTQQNFSQDLGLPPFVPSQEIFGVPSYDFTREVKNRLRTISLGTTRMETLLECLLNDLTTLMARLNARQQSNGQQANPTTSMDPNGSSSSDSNNTDA